MNNALNKEFGSTYERQRNNETLWLLLRASVLNGNIEYVGEAANNQTLYELQEKASALVEYKGEIDWGGQLTKAEKYALLHTAQESRRRWSWHYLNEIEQSVNYDTRICSFAEMYEQQLLACGFSNYALDSASKTAILEFSDKSCLLEHFSTFLILHSKEELGSACPHICLTNAFKGDACCLVDRHNPLEHLAILRSPLIQSKEFRKAAIQAPFNDVSQVRHLFPLSDDEWLAFVKSKPGREANSALLDSVNLTPRLVAKFIVTALGTLSATKLDACIGKLSKSLSLKQNLRGTLAMLRLANPDCFPDARGRVNEVHVNQVREGLRVALVAAKFLPENWEV